MRSAFNRPDQTNETLMCSRCSTSEPQKSTTKRYFDPVGLWWIATWNGAPHVPDRELEMACSAASLGYCPVKWRAEAQTHEPSSFSSSHQEYPQVIRVARKDVRQLTPQLQTDAISFSRSVHWRHCCRLCRLEQG